VENRCEIKVQDTADENHLSVCKKEFCQTQRTGRGTLQGICGNTIDVMNLSGRLTSFQGGHEAGITSTKDLASICYEHLKQLA
jgi:hypothetical protein